MTFRNFPQLSKLKIVDFQLLLNISKSQAKKIEKKGEISNFNLKKNVFNKEAPK